MTYSDIRWAIIPALLQGLAMSYAYDYQAVGVAASLVSAALFYAVGRDYFPNPIYKGYIGIVTYVALSIESYLLLSFSSSYISSKSVSIIAWIAITSFTCYLGFQANKHMHNKRVHT